jgi:prophage regulatory protein
MRRSKRLTAQPHSMVEGQMIKKSAPLGMASPRLTAACPELPASDIAVGAANSRALPQVGDDELWSIKTVTQKTGLSRASIYRYVGRNLFPPSRRIGPGRIAWLASDVVVWMHSRPHFNSIG